MKVFLDTNVWVSALVARGLSADLFRYVLAQHEVLTGEVNLVELKRILRNKFRATADQIELVEAQLRDQTVVPKPVEHPVIRVRDKDDEWVLASAIAGGADILVTGDQDLAAAGRNSPLPILTPREAWGHLRRHGV